MNVAGHELRSRPLLFFNMDTNKRVPVITHKSKEKLEKGVIANIR